MKRILTGVKPTGDGLHLGNYLGAIKPFLDSARGKEAFLFIADYHSLTSVHSGDILRKNKKNILLDYLALTSDLENLVIFEQSKITHINDISWVLSSVTPYSLMLRAHSFKDSQAKNSDINMATFNYPILMSADILAYDTDVVPVGKDQKQHLEFARDIAQSFNKTYGVDFFKSPEAHIVESVQTIPGIDGQKMSKSYNNFIGVFDDETLLKKRIMSIVTDDKTLADSKNPDNCNVFALIELFGDKERVKQIRNKYVEGNYGYGHAKKELLEILLDYFKDARQKRQELENNFDYVESIIKRGNEIANEQVTKKFEELKAIVGLN